MPMWGYDPETNSHHGDPMKAISILQPWASLILSGEKRIENRTWATAYRGPLVIHAGKSRRDEIWHPPEGGPLVFGAFLGTAVLLDCLSAATALRLHPDQYEHIGGPWCWVFADPVPFAEPRPGKGQLRLFECG